MDDKLDWLFGVSEPVVVDPHVTAEAGRTGRNVVAIKARTATSFIF